MAPLTGCAWWAFAAGLAMLAVPTVVTVCTVLWHRSTPPAPPDPNRPRPSRPIPGAVDSYGSRRKAPPLTAPLPPRRREHLN